jgi:hypothetical protein
MPKTKFDFLTLIAISAFSIMLATPYMNTRFAKACVALGGTKSAWRVLCGM